MKPEFTIKLIKWNYEGNNRSMPWKGEKDPYKIWVSEVILQQTRVGQGWEYYRRFIEAFPTIQQLAQAPQQTVFKHWEGLGYYTRCKNLHASAKMLVDEMKGAFPTDYNGIRALKGVGPYTAAAIASFAFNLPYAVVDGNVARVISRYFGINTPIDSVQGKKLYHEIADSLLDKENPGLYNQAIMDFGATICKPKNPLCNECVQKNECQAFRHDWVRILPTKEKIKRKKQRWLTYYLVRFEDQVYVRKRNEKDIWANLFEFVLNESTDSNEQQYAIQPGTIASILGTKHFTIAEVSPFFKQQLTHQTIHGQFVSIILHEPLENSSYHRIPFSELDKYPFPKFINLFLGRP